MVLRAARIRESESMLKERRGAGQASWECSGDAGEAGVHLPEPPSSDGGAAARSWSGLPDGMRWKGHPDDQNALSRPHRLHASLEGWQEEQAVGLHTTVLLPLDDLLAVVRKLMKPTLTHSESVISATHGNCPMPWPATSIPTTTSSPTFPWTPVPRADPQRSTEYNYPHGT